MVTWAEVGRSTDWATQAPLDIPLFRCQIQVPHCYCISDLLAINQGSHKPLLGFNNLLMWLTELRETHLLVYVFIFFNVFIFIFERERERQHVSEGGTEREGDTESEAGSRLWAVSREPDVGLELTDRGIVTWAEVRCLANWATQSPGKYAKPSKEIDGGKQNNAHTPKDGQCSNPGTCGYVKLHHKGQLKKLVDGIKFANQLFLTWGDNLVSSCWTQCMQGPQMGKEAEKPKRERWHYKKDLPGHLWL